MNRRYRQLRRYRDIAETFLRQGFGYFLEQLDLYHLIPFSRRVLPLDEGDKGGSRGARLRTALEQLGPVFVKLGQVLSTRPDMIPADVVEELALLQDRVEPIPFPDIRAAVEEELGMTLEEAYASFDLQPVAAASIGQVHRATLHDGTEVAVKVRRPDIEAVVGMDLEILYSLAGLVEERLHPEHIRPRELVEEFARSLRGEMNYLLEARNQDRFRRQMANDPYIHIPAVFWTHTTERVLTMEFVHGVKVNDLEGIDRLGVDRAAVAERGARSFLEQVLIHGFFHGDPHPGNVFVREDGTLSFLDFGLVGRLDDELLQQIADLFLAMIARDAERVVNVLIRIGVAERTVDRRVLTADMEALIDRYYGKSLRQIEVGRIISESFELARRHRVRLPTDFVLLGKALLTMESTGKQLYPDFNVLTLAEPFAQELVLRRWSPAAVSRRVSREVLDLAEVIIGMPRKMDGMMDHVRAGQLEIKFRHQGLENLIHRLDIVGNRLAAGIIIAALVIGSSLVMQTGRGPFLWGFPLLGIAGFAVAGLIGMWLVFSILRSGRI